MHTIRRSIAVILIASAAICAATSGAVSNDDVSPAVLTLNDAQYPLAQSSADEAPSTRGGIAESPRHSTVFRPSTRLHQVSQQSANRLEDAADTDNAVDSKQLERADAEPPAPIRMKPLVRRAAPRSPAHRYPATRQPLVDRLRRFAGNSQRQQALADAGDTGEFQSSLGPLIRQPDAGDGELNSVNAATLPLASRTSDGTPQPTRGGRLASESMELKATSLRSAQTPDAPPARRTEIRRLEGEYRVTMNLRDEDLRSLLDLLSKEAKLNIVASENVKGTVTASFTDVRVEEALAAILRMTGYVVRREGDFLYVGTAPDLLRMDQMQDVVETRVYRTNYVTAAELQKLITPMLSENIGVVTISTAAKVDIPADTVTTGGDDFAGNEVILVRDYRSVLEKVDKLVDQVDERPRQVVIEAMIMSVNLDDSHRYGINFEMFRGDDNVRLVSGSPVGSLGQIDISGGGLNFGVLNADVGAFVNALESIGDTNVIAAPRLLCLNKQRAEILIGDQKGFISTTQTETSTTQTVEFLDIGTQLRIRPFISDDGVIRLEVHPELSTGEVKLLGGFALPEKSVTQVTTNIMCRDGATVVIGGLIREDFSDARSQVVGLGNVPILGGLLRNVNEAVTRNEIVVLITPRIVNDPVEIAHEQAAPDIFGRQAAVDAQRISPIARHHYSDRYYRLARTAWLAGNTHDSLRYLGLSLNLKPNNAEAHRLQHVVLCAVGEALPAHQPQFGAAPHDLAPRPNPDVRVDQTRFEQPKPNRTRSLRRSETVPARPVSSSNFPFRRP